MDSRSIEFLDVMIAIAVIGVLSFVAGLIVIYARQAAGLRVEPNAPQWYGFVPALVLVVAAAALLVWLIARGGQWAWGESLPNWQSDPRTTAFTLVMIALALVGLVGSLVYTILEASARPRPRSTIEASAVAPGTSKGRTPSRIGPLGPLLLAVAFLLMCWVALPRAEQFALMQQLIYPGSFGVALVLVFDKASRTWGVKSTVDVAREWLFCDTLVFLIFLGFLNLRGVEKPDAYAAAFWDLLNLALFFAVFWLVDRNTSRLRFLAGYAYFILAPLLLLIWRTIQGIPAELSWWGSVWPFFILGAVFFILEIITLPASAPSERRVLPAAKDGLFVLLYAILLIVAVRTGGRA
ncbi:MAG TPA: hypothetical protein VEK55_10280 [Xanthobacteraceae bacterium]|nr:hypothetical protein [Xanthobacteraceae bacterium]